MANVDAAIKKIKIMKCDRGYIRPSELIEIFKAMREPSDDKPDLYGEHLRTLNNRLVDVETKLLGLELSFKEVAPKWVEEQSTIKIDNPSTTKFNVCCDKRKDKKYTIEIDRDIAEQWLKYADELEDEIMYKEVKRALEQKGGKSQ